MRPALLLPILFFTFRLNAQVITLSGSIVDATSGETLPYATLSCPTRGVNTMSNEAGQFIFKIPFEGKKDTVFISHVGFVTRAISAEQATTQGMVIKLAENPRQMSDVVVQYRDPLKLLQEAIDRIPVNYATKPYILDGFYRMTVRNDKPIIDISEAVFSIYGSSYLNEGKTFKLIKSRVDKDMVAFNGNNHINFGRRPLGIIDMDFVGRLHGMEILGDTGIHNHQFTFGGLIDYEGNQAYQIFFDQKDGLNKALFKGTIILDARTLAFLSLTHTFSPKGLLYYYERPNVKQTLERISPARLEYVYDSISISYRLYGGKYYLNHVYETNAHHLFSEEAGIDFHPMRAETDYLVTRVDTTDITPFRKKEILDRNKSIENQGTLNADWTDAFWENYNLIKATYNVDSARQVMQRHQAEKN